MRTYAITKYAITKEAEFTIAMLNFIGRCLTENDLAALRDVRIPYDVAVRINGLTLDGLHRYALRHSRSTPGKVVFDADHVRRTLDHMESDRKREAELHALLRADAPRAMIQAVGFALTKDEYTELRCALNIAPMLGRTPEPDTETALRAWQALMAVLGGRPLSEAVAADYLHVHENTGLSLRVIWKVVEKWNSAETR